MKLIDDLKDKNTPLGKLFRQAFLYGIIGVFCAGLDYGVFTLLTKIFDLNELIANPIGMVVGMLCSFFLNYYFNFKANSRFGLRMASFLIVGTIGVGFSEVIMYIGVSLLEINEMIVKFISIILVAALQFVLNKLITFKGV